MFGVCLYRKKCANMTKQKWQIYRLLVIWIWKMNEFQIQSHICGVHRYIVHSYTHFVYQSSSLFDAHHHNLNCKHSPRKSTNYYSLKWPSIVYMWNVWWLLSICITFQFKRHYCKHMALHQSVLRMFYEFIFDVNVYNMEIIIYLFEARLHSTSEIATGSIKYTKHIE